MSGLSVRSAGRSFVLIADSATAVWAGTALSKFLLHGPISAFVGTIGIGTNVEDIPLVENLGFGTC